MVFLSVRTAVRISGPLAGTEFAQLLNLKFLLNFIQFDAKLRISFLLAVLDFVCVQDVCLRFEFFVLFVFFRSYIRCSFL